jgi:hypothetical protein
VRRVLATTDEDNNNMVHLLQKTLWNTSPLSDLPTCTYYARTAFLYRTSNCLLMLVAVASSQHIDWWVEQTTIIISGRQLIDDGTHRHVCLK